jgi:hypothetical protein
MTASAQQSASKQSDITAFAHQMLQTQLSTANVQIKHTDGYSSETSSGERHAASALCLHISMHPVTAAGCYATSALYCMHTLEEYLLMCICNEGGLLSYIEDAD